MILTMFKAQRIFSFFALILTSLLLFACTDEDLSDDERIQSEVDTASVHLTTGLKILVTNPYDDPEIFTSLNKVKAILDGLEKNDPLSLLEMGKLAKIAYSVKGYGETEVALGKKSEFIFLHELSRDKSKDSSDSISKAALPSAVEFDHAMTLVAMFLLKLQPAAAFSISNKALLYEAWMAGNVELDNPVLFSVFKSSQVNAFARNGFCDFAKNVAKQLSEINASDTKVDIATIKANIVAMTGLGRAAAHAPGVAAILPVALLPGIIELLPGSVRVLAHIETANCFSDKGSHEEDVHQQHQYAVDALIAMSVPEVEVAILRASLAYKQGEINATAKYLKVASTSRYLDSRSKQDLLALSNNIQSPDQALIKEYLSSTYMALAVGKIITQRAIDSGLYDELMKNEKLAKYLKIFNALLSIDTNKILDNDSINKSKDFFNRLTQ